MKVESWRSLQRLAEKFNQHVDITRVVVKVVSNYRAKDLPPMCAAQSAQILNGGAAVRFDQRIRGSGF
jgi:hypothetical protein